MIIMSASKIAFASNVVTVSTVACASNVASACGGGVILHMQQTFI